MTLSELALDQDPGGPVGVNSTNVGCFQNRAQRPFGSNWVAFNKLLVARHHAAEVLRPGPIHTAVYHQMPYLLCPEFLRFWREAQKGIDLPIRKQLHRL